MTGGTLGARMGSARRNRIAYLALLRRAGDHVFRACAARAVAVVAMTALVLPSQHRWPALVVCALAAGATYLLWNNERHIRQGTAPRTALTAFYLDSANTTDGQHRLSIGAYLDLPCSFLLVAVPAWLTVDAPLWTRLGALAAGTLFTISTAMLIFNDHTWFNPDQASPPTWHEIARRLSGVVTTLPVCLIALPAHWGQHGFLTALAITLLPLTISVRLADLDLMVTKLPQLVREESHEGRELVISETHGALSTHLRLIEQQARELRQVAPTLYELAVSANSRLRETLTLAQVGLETSRGVENLAAPVFTLARAVGARAGVEVKIDSLGGADRDLARLILSDLVGNALNAGAAAIDVEIAPVDRLTAISVTDDAPPMVPGVWKTPGTSSARLEARLAELAGSLTVDQHSATKTVTARWLASQD